jgi:hypothetical protein
MSSTYADCPVCGFESKVDDELVAQPIECPKCKKVFTVEVGESYGVDGHPAPRPDRAPARSEPPESESEEPEGPGEKSWLEAWPQD